MTLRERLADVARFMVRPTYAERSMAWRPGFASALALMTGLNLLLVMLAGGLVDLAFGSSGVLPELAENLPLSPRDVFNYILLAPVLEEPLHRGWLTGRKAALRFAAFGGAALTLLLAGYVIGSTSGRILSLLAVAVVFAGLIQWGLTRTRDHIVPDWFIRHFRWMVWGSSVVFGLVHLGRFEALTHPLGALVVLPLMLGGLLLAYTRTRLGLRAAMVQHACYNAVIVGLVALADL